MVNTIRALVLGLQMQACVTTRPSRPPPLPVLAESIFDQCQSGDGALTVNIRSNSEAWSLATEWVLTPGGWTIEGFSPLGQTLLNARYAASSGLEIRGQALRLPNISLDESGFLVVDGYFVPMRAGEVGCFLKHQLPAAWKGELQEWERAGDLLRLNWSEPKRHIEVEYQGASTLTNRSLCTSLSWWRFWPLWRVEMQICTTLEPPFKGTLKGLGAYEIWWSTTAD